MIPAHSMSMNVQCSVRGVATALQALSKLLDDRAYISPDAASKRKGAVLVGVDATLVQVTDVQLNAGMVFRGDELVCPRAAPGQPG